MTSALDYEKIAHLYDSYCLFTEDIPFFLENCQKVKGSVLELMCGTGRISIPLLEAGVNLTCMDASPAMLDILRQKLAARGLNALVVQAEVTDFNLETFFNLILLPFQSFHELQTEALQRKALNEIARLLKPSGIFICTLHNPRVRIQSINQGSREYGPFPRIDGVGFVSLSVELSHHPETGMVRGLQAIFELNSAGQKVAEYQLPVQFSLIEFDVFQNLLQSAGFSILEVFGNYDFSPFLPESSPYIIVRARKL